MKKSARTPRLRTIYGILLSVFVFIAALLVAESFRASAGYRRMQEATQIYISSRTDANDLQRGSDYLTEQVRLYAVTADKQYMDNFFVEAETTRRRDKAVENMTPLMTDRPALEYLNKAMSYSNELIEIEYYAIRLVCEAKGMREAEMPEAVRTVSLTEADRARTAEEKQQEAVRIVFTGEYSVYKENIRRNVEACLNDLLAYEESVQEENAAALRHALLQENVLIGLFTVLMLLMILLTYRLLINPLGRAAGYIRAQKKVPERGAEEVIFLARAYNEMYEHTRRIHDELEQEAAHDALTGLYNRTAYEKLTADLHEEKLCFILMDVDKFKSVNDTYGHDQGDLVLRKVAEVLKHQFRSGDMIFRLGGDEFAVIMVNTGTELQDLVRRKIMTANEELNRGEGIPPVSLSAGAVFGSQTVDDALFKRADVILYRTKNSGGNNIGFEE